MATGLVTGVFADGSHFAVNLYGDATASHVRLSDVPEPSSIVLLGIGAVSLFVADCGDGGGRDKIS